jgi:hypothetical protein
MSLPASDARFAAGSGYSIIGGRVGERAVVLA